MEDETLFERQPAGVIGGLTTAVVGVVAATIILLNAFGVEVTDTQRDAIIGLVVAIFTAAPLVAGLLIRRKVSPFRKP